MQAVLFVGLRWFLVWVFDLQNVESWDEWKRAGKGATATPFSVLLHWPQASNVFLIQDGGL